jgi:hypothetical protein
VQRVLITRNTAGQLMLFNQTAYRTSYGNDWSTSAMMLPKALANNGQLCAQPWCTNTMFQQLQPKPKPETEHDPEQVLPSAY